MFVIGKISVMHDMAYCTFNCYIYGKNFLNSNMLNDSIVVQTLDQKKIDMKHGDCSENGSFISKSILCWTINKAFLGLLRGSFLFLQQTNFRFTLADLFRFIIRYLPKEL